ncbi:polysaccharide pyruvyl transferase family protein [Streptomyces sp. JB150]|uniref:polysaccharide pyruvyl transferase family protein n=1 Tax=Streptomyces sp. JB150 TaxID=2714844 RepID=UPI00140767B7|nr:polysaccharide pyruvyl transferase family protein [Streptomyces sp. JB150]QIJ64356.1 polysaccharide pyruvyl transferase family protein [Streptomyces sp. JB150]
MTHPPHSHPATARAFADDSSTVTGKRRIAFAVHTGADRLPEVATLVRSLTLTNPGVCEDVVVLHPGLPASAFDALRALHPRIVPRRADGRGDVVRLEGYDTVVALTPAMVVLGDVGELLRLRHGVGAVRQVLDGGAAGERWCVRPDGLLVLQRADVDEDLAARLADALGDRGDGGDGSGSGGGGDTGHGGPGGLESVLGDLLVPVDPRYDFLAHRLHGDLPVPPRVAVLRFTGPSGEDAPGPAAEARRRFAMGDDEFRAAYRALPGAKHPDLLAHLAPPLLRARPSLDLARTVADGYRRQGRYDEAVDVLAPVLGDRLDAPRCQETLGLCLMALSRYDEAEAHLLLAAASPDVAPRAFAQLARLAWILGRDEDARRYAREGLEADPTDAGCHAWFVRTRPAAGPEPADAGPAGGQLAHVALFAEGRENAGDRVLPEAVRLCFGPDTGPRRWYPQPVHRLVDEAALARLNARRGVVVGGGGLFLPDTSPNGNSHWQWNIPDDVLARITAPLAVFAVGYNVFDGQRYRRGRFAESLRALVERSAFFGLRNHGSIERVRDLLPAALRDRVRYQPCPTTVARRLVPGWTDPAARADTVLVNCAYDRAGLRFGHDYGHFLGQMAVALRDLRERADVRYAAHMPDDERFVHDLRREHGVALPVERLYDLSNDAIRDLYGRSRLVIGMRGHAGMIPFGCGTPILSLVSHPKLAYFLADIGRPEWGLSVHDRWLGPRLAERAGAVLDAHPAAVADVHAAQDLLWETTRSNLRELGEIFGQA